MAFYGFKEFSGAKKVAAANMLLLFKELQIGKHFIIYSLRFAIYFISSLNHLNVH